VGTLPLFILSLLVISATAFLINAILEFRSRIAWLLALYLTSTTIVVLTAEIAGLFKQLGQPLFFLTIQGAIFIAAILVWIKKGQPGIWNRLPFQLPDLARKFRGISPFLKTLTLGVGLAYAVNAFLVVYVPPNTYDALTTHLTRVRFWMQNGSFLPWKANYLPQVIYPLNAQVQYLWLILLGGSDRLVGGVQYLAWLASLIAITGIARILGSSRRQALFAALIWSTFPQILMQSTSTQNDLTAAAYFTSGLFFFFIGLRSNDMKSLVFSAVGIALALGTKQTIVFLLPGLAAAIVIFLAMQKPAAGRRIFLWASTLAAGFLLVGSYMYFQNFSIYRDFFGPPNTTSGMFAQSQKLGGLKGVLLNSTRFSYQAADPSGLPGELPGYIQKFKSKVSEYAGLKEALESEIGTTRVFESRSLPALHEDSTWFGLVGFLLLIPFIFIETWHGIRRRDPYRLAIASMAISFCVCLVLFRPGWDPYQGRYFTVPVTITAACMAFFYRETRGRKFWLWVVGVVSLIIMTTSLMGNQSKPLIGNRAIWSLDRYSMQSVSNPRDSQVYRGLERFLPSGASIGYSSSPSGAVYALFGQDLTRKLIYVAGKQNITDAEFIRSLEIEYFFVRNDSMVGLPKMGYIKRVLEFRDWSLYQINFPD
jgi:4-amino-4-deoxy-L-arabinose transferase-like glycosyltransferase